MFIKQLLCDWLISFLQAEHFLKKHIIMQLNHIALTISNASEIFSFYEEILCMKREKCFELYQELSEKIFSISIKPEVFLMKNDSIVFELFVNENTCNLQNFNHICIELEDREAIVTKAERSNYEVIRIEREKFDLIFIKDNSGNLFEIKELEN